MTILFLLSSTDSYTVHRQRTLYASRYCCRYVHCTFTSLPCLSSHQRPSINALGCSLSTAAPAVWTRRVYHFSPAVRTRRVFPFPPPEVWTCRVFPVPPPAVFTCGVQPMTPFHCQQYGRAFKGAQRRFQGIDPATLGIDSWAPYKVYKFGL